MKLKEYQRKAINKLFDNVIDQLNEVGNRRKIVFQAPTGAGKTVMATELMRKLALELQDTDCQFNKAAYIWLAPNALHIQSYLKMKTAFSETKLLEPVVYDDLDLSSDGCIESGQVFFVNWQSINKQTNVMVRGSEQTASIYDIIENTRRQNTAIICIIDEEHMFAGANAKKSENVLHKINPKVELRISATPVTHNEDAKQTISRQAVISEGMIKQNISLNPAIGKVLADSNDEKLNFALLKEALKKRDQIAKKYRELGVNINPLLLIQLPNDETESLSRDEDTLKTGLITQLQSKHGISTDNGRLAIWLAGEKTNLDGIEAENSMVDVLLFKQAIALGWDCPRASVLLIFRKLSSFTFTIQTVGRIMRMPQQHFYGTDLLDRGYVYTDLSADMIRVEPDDAHYINTLHSYLREGIQNVQLTSDKEERSNKENNILRSDFRKLFCQWMSDTWTLQLQQSLFSYEEDSSVDADLLNQTQRANKQAVREQMKIQFDVARIQIEIPSDMEIWDEARDYVIENKTGYARTNDELAQVFDKLCGSFLGGWSKSKALPLLESTIIDTMNSLFGLDEISAKKVVLYHDNLPKFRTFIEKALNKYKNEIMPKKLGSKMSFVAYPWSLPTERIYSDATNHVREDVQNHATMLFYEDNEVFTPEKRFTEFLEKNTPYIDWWYKNADSGSDAFAVRYTHTDGREHLFYVDYVIRMKNGTICLFDTKSMGGDQESVHKHNALIDYMEREKANTGENIIGGILIEDGGSWKYSPMYINNAKDVTGWNSFFPDQFT